MLAEWGFAKELAKVLGNVLKIKSERERKLFVENIEPSMQKMEQHHQHFLTAYRRLRDTSEKIEFILKDRRNDKSEHLRLAFAELEEIRLMSESGSHIRRRFYEEACFQIESRSGGKPTTLKLSVSQVPEAILFYRLIAGYFRTDDQYWHYVGGCVHWMRATVQAAIDERNDLDEFTGHFSREKQHIVPLINRIESGWAEISSALTHSDDSQWA